MAGNTIGELFRLTSFGESHGVAIGGVIDGCPAGLEIDPEFILSELYRRKTGLTLASSARQEDDQVEILSGVYEGRATGTPLAFIIRNRDQKPEDYTHLKDTYRPSHADLTYELKYGFRDHRGGGRASARETAVRVVAGAIAKLLLVKAGVSIKGYVSQIGNVSLEADYNSLDLAKAESSPVRCPDKNTADSMVALLDKISRDGDTVGGVVTCVVTGVPPGLGEPVFDRLEAGMAKAIMSINAVKGFDIGSGIRAAEALGSGHNDPFVAKAGSITTKTNYSGGVQGGITNGQDIYFRAFFKPVATLMKDQQSVDREGKPITLKGKGRHDVCVVPRAVPIVESMAALTLADFYLKNLSSKIK